MPRIENNYERASVNMAYSTVMEVMGVTHITLNPFKQGSEVISDEERWLEFAARIVGALNLAIKFTVLNVYGAATNNGYHGAPWQPTRKPMYSYDRKKWFYFDNCKVDEDSITFSNNSVFISDIVYVGRDRQFSVSDAGEWLESLKHPALSPAPSAVAWSPTNAVSGFPGQQFIADEFSPQSYKGKNIPATPFYAGQINDTSLKPASGNKRIVVLASGVHAGEDHGNFILKAVIEEALSDSADAIIFRTNNRVPFYPIVNAPGRWGGGWRGSFTKGYSGEDDANRHYSKSQTGLEIIDKSKKASKLDLAGSTVSAMIDFHGTYLGPWSVLIDVNSPSSVKFMNDLSANCGYPIVNEGMPHPGGLSEYYRTLGAAPSITHETGCPYPITDAEIVRHAKGVIKTLAGNVSQSTVQPGVIVPPVVNIVTPQPAAPVLTINGTGTATWTINADGSMDIHIRK